MIWTNGPEPTVLYISLDHDQKTFSISIVRSTLNHCRCRFRNHSKQLRARLDMMTHQNGPTKNETYSKTVRKYYKTVRWRHHIGIWPLETAILGVHFDLKMRLNTSETHWDMFLKVQNIDQNRPQNGHFGGRIQYFGASWVGPVTSLSQILRV